MPMTLPSISNSGPPELPALMATSVCSMLMGVRSGVISRSSALMSVSYTHLTAAVYAARMEGLCTAGIIDHDSISGAREFLAAAEIVGMPVTVGMECRVSMDGTALQGRRTNNPDQVGVSYMTIQSVPHDKIEMLNAWFAPYRAARGRRNRAMVEKINALLPGIALDYDCLLYTSRCV